MARCASALPATPTSSPTPTRSSRASRPSSTPSPTPCFRPQNRPLATTSRVGVSGFHFHNLRQMIQLLRKVVDTPAKGVEIAAAWDAYLAEGVVNLGPDPLFHGLYGLRPLFNQCLDLPLARIGLLTAGLFP